MHASALRCLSPRRDRPARIVGTSAHSVPGLPQHSRSRQMSDVKKDHSLGAGTGAVAGAVTGAAVGSAVGPVGTVVGAVAGGVVGAKAGDSIAEAVNPTDYEDHFKN